MSRPQLSSGQRRGFVLTLAGPSGVGKTSILRYLEERFGVHTSPKYTTRPSRGTEDDARDFIFCQASCFPQSGLLEFESYGHLFGIQLGRVEQSLRMGACHAIVVGDSDVTARLAEIYPNEVRSIFVFCEQEVLRERAFGSGTQRAERWSHVLQELGNVYIQLSPIQFVINNGGTFERTLIQVDQVWEWLNL